MFRNCWSLEASSEGKSKGSGLFGWGLGDANLLAATGTDGRLQVEPIGHGLDPVRGAKPSAPLG